MPDDRLRCHACGTRRRDGLLLMKHKVNCRLFNTWCQCGGPAFVGGLSKHRPGTMYCDSHPEGPLHVALRYAVNKADEEEILKRWTEEMAARKKLAEDIPF